MPTIAPPAASPADAHDALRRARVYLARVAEPPATSLAAFVEAHGPIEAAARVRSGDVPDTVLQETGPRREQDLVDEDLAAAAQVGARLILPEESEWPSGRMLCLSAAATRGITWAAPPMALWVRGLANLADILGTAVSIAGSQTASSYGEPVAAEFGYGLAAAGTTVVAGTSYGVEGAAHRGALAADGTTLAVLACGIDLTYPAGHRTLIDRIAGQGLVISEYPPAPHPPGAGSSRAGVFSLACPTERSSSKAKHRDSHVSPACARPRSAARRWPFRARSRRVSPAAATSCCAPEPRSR